MVNQTINSVGHALRCIDLLAAQQGPVGLTFISAELGLPRATVLRVLATLISHGYAWKEDRRYGLTMHLRELGGRSRAVVPAEVERLLEELCTETGLTVHLALLDGDRAYYAAKVDPPGPLPMASYVGWRGPLHATAAGHALLLGLDSSWVDEHLPEELPAYTPNTITDRRELARSIDERRSSGFVVDDEELMLGLRCVALPLPAHPRIAVSIAGPTARLPLKDVDGCVERMRGSVHALDGALMKGRGFG